MKITLFTGNQPRHLALAERLSKLSDTVFVVSEVNTIFPGLVDDFFMKSQIMQKYFKNVLMAENALFGEICFPSSRVKVLPIKAGDLNFLNQTQLGEVLDSDYFIVFGSSYIKGWLIDFLVNKQAINIHMGISPYYRGSSCNFWALYDRNPGYVGSTLHFLSKGLDSGNILRHCLPKFDPSMSSYDFTMRSVLAAHVGLEALIRDDKWSSRQSIKQDKQNEVRYSINADFDDDCASQFMSRDENEFMTNFHYPDLVDPLFY